VLPLKQPSSRLKRRDGPSQLFLLTLVALKPYTPSITLSYTIFHSTGILPYRV
jgi:hypothetical protein